ncbi:hypothetical protein DPMN_179712, partial [Dreissena polymorpha]
MASKSDKMDGKLVKVVFAILLTRCAFSTKTAKFKMSAPLSVTYEDTITKSAVNRFACLSLCNEGCRFVVYSNSGPDAGVCDLYYLKDAIGDRCLQRTLRLREATGFREDTGSRHPKALGEASVTALYDVRSLQHSENPLQETGTLQPGQHRLKLAVN